MATKVFIVLSMFILIGCVYCDDTILDMTYPLEAATLHWPKNLPFKLTNKHRGPYNNAPYVDSNIFESAEHLGTHMDAPAHFSEGKWYLDEIPIENFVGPAVVVDISARAAEDPDTTMTVADLEAWEKKHGKMPKGSILLVNSGWGKFWGNNSLFRGNDTDDERYLHFPGINADAAHWIVNSGKIKGIGIDTLSFDVGSSLDYPAHQIILGANIFALEMVANIDKLPAKGATLYVFPMKIVGGSGGATRIIATGYKGVKGGGKKVLPGVIIVLMFSLALIFCD